MDEIIKRKKPLTGEIEDARRYVFMGLDHLIRTGYKDLMVEGTPLFYVGKGNTQTIDGIARRIDEQDAAG